MFEESENTVRAEIYDFSRDVNGNTTARFTLWHRGAVLYKANRRQQTGCNSYSDGALVKARVVLKSPNLEVVSYNGERGQGCRSWFDIA